MKKVLVFVLTCMSFVAHAEDSDEPTVNTAFGEGLSSVVSRIMEANRNRDFGAPAERKALPDDERKAASENSAEEAFRGRAMFFPALRGVVGGEEE